MPPLQPPGVTGALCSPPTDRADADAPPPPVGRPAGRSFAARPSASAGRTATGGARWGLEHAFSAQRGIHAGDDGGNMHRLPGHHRLLGQQSVGRSTLLRRLRRCGDRVDKHPLFGRQHPGAGSEPGEDGQAEHQRNDARVSTARVRFHALDDSLGGERDKKMIELNPRRVKASTELPFLRA